MINTFPLAKKFMDVGSQQRRALLSQIVWIGIITAITAIMAFMMWRGSPQPSHIAWVCFWVGIAAIIYHPRNGIYIMVALTLAGDAVLTWWAPFNKNLSSGESLLFLANGISISPLEITIVLTFGYWILRMAFQRKWEVQLSLLLIPIAAFTLFVAFGLLYGAVYRRGDLTMALWESRAMFYILPVYLLVSNLIVTRKHVKALLWSILVPIGINGLIGLNYVHSELEWQLAGVESIGEHSLSIYFNVFFVIFTALWMYRGSASKRMVSLLLVLPVLISYFANNRRASFITMGIVLLILAFVLFRRYRVRFWLIVPPLAVLGIAYLVVFWNVEAGPISEPAQAVRSVLGEPNPRDASSNDYRVLETINILFTIKTAPLLGIGFGHKFYRIVDLADISTFPFYEYIPHNSILWIWIKLGAGGFLAMLTMLGMAIANGVRTLWRMPNDEMSVVALTALSFIIMFLIFAYVDIAWGGTNMTMLATMMALGSSLMHIVGQQPPLPGKRWPWQREPEPLPGLFPLPPSKP
jgi:O-antigen ligase